MTELHSIAPPWITYPDLRPIRTDKTAMTRAVCFVSEAIDWLQIWEPMPPAERELYLAQWQTSALKFPPPWVLMPHLEAFQSWRQGYQEVFMEEAWFPYWHTLLPEEQALYFEFWNASSDWQARIAWCCKDDNEDEDDYPKDARWHITIHTLCEQNRVIVTLPAPQSGWRHHARTLLRLPPKKIPFSLPRITTPPPWYFAPDLRSDSTNKIVHRYIADYWRPDWLAYSDEFRARSLEEWAITSHWQDAIARWTDPATFDAEADAKSSADFSAAFDKTLRAGHARKTGSQDPFSPEHGGPDAALRAAGFDPETPSGQELRDYISYCWPRFWRGATLKERDEYLRKWAESSDTAPHD